VLIILIQNNLVLVLSL